MAVHIAKPEHEAAFQELSKLLMRHAAKVSALDMLAIAANMVGKIVAMQDQRVISPASAMEVVAKNIEIGNEQMLKSIRDDIAGRS